MNAPQPTAHVPPSVTEAEYVRAHFPQLAGSDRVYMDSAATSLKPGVVIESVRSYLAGQVAGVHRGTHAPSQRATERYEAARRAIAAHLGAASAELVFTASVTAGLDLLARALSATRPRVWLTPFEHHSNILPWMSSYKVEMLPCDPHGRIDLERLRTTELRSDDVVSVAQASNVTGLVQPVPDIAEVCQRRGALLVVDAAQSVPHLQVDMAELGCDFLVFGAHKAFGPEGVGVIFGRAERWRELAPPSLGGGSVEKVSLRNGVSLRPIPYRFESGSPNVSGVIGAAVGLDFLVRVREAAQPRLERLRAYMAGALASLPGVRVIAGEADGPRVPIVTIAIRGAEPEVLAMLLSDRYKIDARGGFHCTHPLYETFSTAGGIRFSMQTYTSDEDCARVVDALRALAGES